MLDNPFPSLQQTHVGWRTPTTEAGHGEDHLVIAEPPQVSFVNESAAEIHFSDAAAPDGSVEDCTMEGPSFLWTGSEETPTTEPPVDVIRESMAPVVVFGETRESEKQIFS